MNPAIVSATQTLPSYTPSDTLHVFHTITPCLCHRLGQCPCGCYQRKSFCFNLLDDLQVAYALIHNARQTSARSTGLVRLTEHRDAFGSPVYSWMISQDEQERLSALLKGDFNDTGIEGTYVTAPPQVCPHCGKETEFIDWRVSSDYQCGIVHYIDLLFHRVYTALERGVHSPEFIFESLRAGHTPKGVHHDVYCSGCGYLTHVRDSSGNEGGALHISHATVLLAMATSVCEPCPDYSTSYLALRPLY